MTKKQTQGKELDPGMRQYLIEFESGEKKRITVPDNWKVTFGPIAIMSKSPGVRVPIALRFYEDENRQRAIFVEVRSFRDLGIPLEELKVEHRGKRAVVNMDGVEKHVTIDAVHKEWVNPDAEVNTPAASEAFAQLEWVEE